MPSSTPTSVRSVEQPYSSTDVANFQEKFKAVAENFRRRRKRATRIGLCAVCAMCTSIALVFLIGAAFPHAHLSVGWLIVPVWAVGALSIILTQAGIPKLKCPGCDKGLEGDIGNYCPECGSNELQPGRIISYSQLQNQSKEELKNGFQGLAPGGFRSWPQCGACGCKLAREKAGGKGGRKRTRSYKIRFCTYCGLQLGQEC